MRRILLVAGAALALSLTSAGAALAHGHGHAASRHASRHHRHHKHAHIVRFVASHSTTTTTSSTPPASGSPTTEPETVATVASFTNGVLTLKLADGSTVSGKVTEDTRIECLAPAGAQEESDDDQGGGDDNHGVPGPSGFPGHGQEGDDMHGSSQGESGDDDGGEDGQGVQSCGTSALVEGAKVAEAELRVGAGAATWEKVELIG